VSESKGRKHKSLSVATYCNIAGLALLFAVENFAAETNWVATVLAYAPQQPFGLLFPILMSWSVATRAWRLLAVNVVGIVLFAVFLLGFNVPCGCVLNTDGRSLRLVTYNIHHGSRGPDRVADVIKRLDADIICLQETNGCGKWPCPVSKICGFLPQYHVFHHGQLTVISRLPFLYTKSHCLPSLYGATREFLEVKISFGGKPFTVFNVHFHSPAGKGTIGGRKVSLRRYISVAAELRHTHLTKLIGALRRTDGAYTIVGDLNTPPTGRFYRAVLGQGVDAFRAAAWGFGYTYTSELPLVRIDHIIVSPNIKVIACRTISCSASDHRLVLADLVPGN